MQSIIEKTDTKESSLSNNTVIKVEGVGKEYHLGAIAKDSIKDTMRNFFTSAKKEKETFWALKDISFEVKEGEVLGIVGKNGAGKSTLLKILSRITYPTEGKITMDGRVASLLEVGTGFHPELTGRENIFLNGSILGMSRKEIKDKFEEIVAFSGVEKFIDTPVKHYSSGMYVRLAFSVAAHLEPEILIIDEVLAVGDAEFQKKCLGKMKDVAGQGRTVLFVSHNMSAVKSLCSKAIVLKSGKFAFEGSAEDAVHFYLNMENNGISTLRNFKTSTDANQESFQLHSFSVRAENKKINDPIIREDPLLLETVLDKKVDCVLNIVIRFKDNEGNIIFVCNNQNTPTQVGKHTYILKIPNFFFNEGNFSLDIAINDGRKPLFMENDVASFNIIQESRKLGEWMGTSKGAIRPNFNWVISK